MSYKIGQFIGRKNNSYMEDITDGVNFKTDYPADNQLFSSHIFKNSGFYIPTPGLERGVGYLLQITIEKTTDVQNFLVKLKNDSIEIAIKAITVQPKTGTEVEFESYDIEITPEINNVSDIILELERTAIDYDRTSSSPCRFVNVEDTFKLYKVKNIVEQFENFSTLLNTIKSFTIEQIDDNTDLSFIITGEAIKIGTDKFFELHEEMGLSISYLGFLLDPNQPVQQDNIGTPYFIINYKYE